MQCRTNIGKRSELVVRNVRPIIDYEIEAGIMQSPQ